MNRWARGLAPRHRRRVERHFGVVRAQLNEKAELGRALSHPLLDVGAKVVGIVVVRRSARRGGLERLELVLHGPSVSEARRQAAAVVRREDRRHDPLHVLQDASSRRVLLLVVIALAMQGLARELAHVLRSIDEEYVMILEYEVLSRRALIRLEQLSPL